MPATSADEVLTVAAVDPGLADPGMGRGDPVEQSGAGDRVLHAGPGDHYREQEAERVDDDAALPAHDPLRGVDALFGGGDARRRSAGCGGVDVRSSNRARGS